MDAQKQIAWLRAGIEEFDKLEIDECARAIIARKTDILRRRIFAIEKEIEFTNPFSDVDETLYRIGGRP